MSSRPKPPACSSSCCLRSQFWRFGVEVNFMAYCPSECFGKAERPFLLQGLEAAFLSRATRSYILHVYPHCRTKGVTVFLEHSDEWKHGKFATFWYRTCFWIHSPFGTAPNIVHFLKNCHNAAENVGDDRSEKGKLISVPGYPRNTENSMGRSFMVYTLQHVSVCSGRAVTKNAKII